MPRMPGKAVSERDITATVRMVVAEGTSADALAVALADRQLAGEEPDTAELEEALAEASSLALVQIYQRAEDQRSRTWRHPDSKTREQHDYTIAVFRALIRNDHERRFHRHFGSMGYALKDRGTGPPDYSGAIDNLTTAISIRGEANRSGFALYEWVRAACRILASTGERTEIEADLRVAARRLGPGLFKPWEGGDAAVNAVARWLQANNLDYESLRGGRSS